MLPSLVGGNYLLAAYKFRRAPSRCHSLQVTIEVYEYVFFTRLAPARATAWLSSGEKLFQLAHGKDKRLEDSRAVSLLTGVGSMD